MFFIYGIMDLRLYNDRAMCVAGPSQSGKTHFVLHLLERRHELFREPIDSVLWCYGIRDEHLMNILQGKGYQTHRGLPQLTDIKANSICILDDLLQESENSKDVTNMFTKAAHHLPCFIIFITQSLFPGGREARTRSLNTHYYVIFKNPRDKLQFETLSRQIAPHQSKALREIYLDATSEPHGYLFIDFTQECSDAHRYRSNVLDVPVKIYKLL